MVGWWTGTMQRTEMCIRFLIHHPFDYDPLVYPSLIWNRVKILYSNRVIQYCNKWRWKFPLFLLCICIWKIGNYNINTDSLGKNFCSVLYLCYNSHSFRLLLVRFHKFGRSNTWNFYNWNSWYYKTLFHFGRSIKGGRSNLSTPTIYRTTKPITYYNH